MSIEAMEQAIEALEKCYDVDSYPGDGTTLQDKAIATLRAAIEQAESYPPECQTEAEKTAYAFGYWKGLGSKRNEQAQPVTVYQLSMKNGGTSSAWIDVSESEYNSAKMYAEYKCRVLYISPPQRQWVGLTDEEIEACRDEIRTRLMNTYSIKDIYQVLESKLKEKNT